MKRDIIFIVLIFNILSSYSQSLNYGVGVGLNSSSLISVDYEEENLNYKLGTQFNIIVKYNFNETFGVSIEPGFSNRGTIWRSKGYSDAKINLNYIILPVTASYTLFNKFSIFVGPECSYIISAKAKTDAEINDVTSLHNSKTSFGIIVGLSYQIIDKFDVSIRYNRAVIPTIKDIRLIDENGKDKGEIKFFNQGFTLSVAYRID